MHSHGIIVFPFAERLHCTLVGLHWLWKFCGSLLPWKELIELSPGVWIWKKKTKRSPLLTGGALEWANRNYSWTGSLAYEGQNESNTLRKIVRMIVKTLSGSAYCWQLEGVSLIPMVNWLHHYSPGKPLCTKVSLHWISDISNHEYRCSFFLISYMI